jgi:hypothetical protein
MNSCEQCREWIKDAALGALEPRRERELLAHAGECDACREAYAHAREVAAFVDRGMESLVAGKPSPRFTARLRARIAEEQPAPRFTWLTSKPVATGLVAAAAAMLALSAAFLIPKHANELQPKPTPNVASAVTAVPPARLQNGRPRGSAPASYADAHPAAAAGTGYWLRVHPARAGYSASAVHYHNHRREPEVLIPPGQLEAVMQLAADIRSGRIDGKQLIAQQKQMEQPLKIDPLAISPLAKPQPYLYPPSDTLPDSAEP